MSKRQVTVRVETFLTIEVEGVENTLEEDIDTLIENMDYNFTADPDFPGTVIDTEITEHEIRSTTDLYPLGIT
jgi:hypothetical protein